MRLTTYSEVLASLADEMGWNRDADGAPLLDDAEWHGAKRALSRSFARVWDSAYWPDLCRTELRQYHPTYDLTEAVTAGTFRFFPPTGRYYQALRDSTGQSPATLATPTSWTTNLAYWADASRVLTAEAWDTTATYAVADQVYSPDTDTFHQMHTTAVAGTAVTDVTAWGEVSELDPFVPWVAIGQTIIGEVAGVFRFEPNKYRESVPVAWRETVNGIQILDPRLNEVWIKFRLRVPRFTGDVWSATAAYSPSTDEGTGGSVTPPATPSLTAHFATVAAMLATDPVTWDEAICYNYGGLDGILTVWSRSTDAVLLPNGTDVLQTVGGVTVFRTYMREGLGGPSVPPPAGGSYIVSVPIVYETMTDARSGVEYARYAIVKRDLNGNIGTFEPGGSGDDGVNSFLNLAGVYYQRL